MTCEVKETAVEDVLSFWFGDTADDQTTASRQAGLWWKKNPATDDAIRGRFESCVLRALRGEYATWEDQPQGLLGLILLTDQFTRNMYRDTPLAFAADFMARHWCNALLHNEGHRQLRPIERVFVYLPLEHSEDRDDQEYCVRLFRELANEASGGAQETFDGFLDFAVRHRDIIFHFGRFPHRNHLLGRTSSDEELAFLATPNSGF